MLSKIKWICKVLGEEKHGHLVEDLKIVGHGPERLWDVGKSKAGITRDKNGKVYKGPSESNLKTLYHVLGYT